MRVLIAGILLGVALTFFAGTPIRAADCEFRLGFKALRDLIGHDIVGECLENEFYNAIGDSNQHTTGGLMAWRKADNWTAFTDGYRTWINGPNGLVQRLNTERFEWEADHIHTPPPTPGPAPTALPQPSLDPTLAHAYHIMRRSHTGNQVANTFVRLGASVQFGTDGSNLTSWSEIPPSIRLHESYRRESYEMQAFMLIYPTVLMASVVDFGQPQSWEQCMSRRVEAYTQSAKYWLETYGSRGKQSPTEEEEFANAVLAAHLDNGIRRTLAMDTICDQFGTPSTPTPTPTPKRTIDPVLGHALEVLRSTRTGRDIANKFFQSGASAVFGPLDGSSSQVSFTPRRITINQEYRGESPEALAHALIWPAMAISVYVEQGNSGSWEECMNREVSRERLQAQWWLEKFGTSGKQNPTKVEQWANNGLSWLRTQNSRNVWMNTHYREQCETHGPAPHIDPDLADAFVTALWDESEIGRWAVDAVVEAGTEVVFGRVGGWGSYSPSQNLITISEELRGYSNQVLASVLVHEAYHVASHARRGGQRQATPAECLQEEVDAFRLSARRWYDWYGRNGKSNPNRVERTNNSLMWAWFSDELREWVLLSDGYQYQCLGGTVE
ncbi:MAG: hypothetical protein OXE05_13475 [Chloroflexi bacterium]|nr:hypothetical protein [Chloroflexota bacterium]